MPNKKKTTVKCEGRFSQLRESFYNDVVPHVLEDRTTFTSRDLKNIWELASDDLKYSNLDIRDPYFFSNVDSLRNEPVDSPLSLVPLVEYPSFYIDRGLVEDYSYAMGNDQNLSQNLSIMEEHPDSFFRRTLNRESSTISLPDGKNLSGYNISADFGIGTLVDGGVSGGGIKSDSPFLLSIYQPKDKRGEFGLAGVVGFWAQNNEMLISQIQSCRNGRFPKDVPFGVGALRVAEVAAQEMGFNKILLYNARGHPMFKEYPDSWNQLGKDFVCVWDGSAKKLGYDGSRNAHYEKRINS